MIFNGQSFRECTMAKIRKRTCASVNICLLHSYLKARVVDILHTVKVEVVPESQYKVDGMVPGVSAHLDSDCLLYGCLVGEHRQTAEVTNYQETHIVS